MKCNGCKERPRYKHNVSVQSLSGTPDGHGQIDATDSTNWTAAGTIKANFITKSGSERKLFDRVEANVTHVIETPSTAFSRTIEPEMRLVYDSRYFNVTAAFDINEEFRTVQVHVTEAV